MKQKRPNYDRKFTTAELKDFHAQAMKRFQQARSYWSVIYQRAEDDVEFRWGNQWVDAARGNRGDRPILTQNLTNAFVDRVVNEGVKLNPEIVVSGSDLTTNPDMADDLQARVRFIEQSSSASVAYTTALDFSASGGFGFIRVRNEYKDESSFDQKITVERVINPFSIILDPKFKDITGSDAMWGFQVDKMPLAQYDEEFPKADHTDWPDTPFIIGDWYDGEQVTVCEYAFKTQEEDELIQLEDGREILASEMDDAEGNLKPEYAEARIETQRKVKRDCVVWLKMDGNRVLEHTILPCKYLPWVFVAGREAVYNFRRDFFGLVHALRDPQAEINYCSSLKTELIALSPKAPWIVEFSQIRGLEKYWDNANTANFAYLPYNATIVEGSNGQLVPPPQRTTFEPQIQAVSQAEAAAFERMKQITGIYDLGMPTPIGTESPDAILLRQEQADSSILKFLYNLKMSVTQVGRIIVDMIPTLSSHEQDMKFMSAEDKVSTKRVGPNTFAYDPDEMDIIVSTGKSYTTRKAEVGRQMGILMSQLGPEKSSNIAHLYVDQLDLGPSGRKISSILKKMVPPQLIEEEDGKPQQLDPAQVQMIMQQQDDIIQRQQSQLADLMQQLNDKQADREVKIDLALLDVQKDLTLAEIRADAEIQKARGEVSEKLVEKGIPQNLIQEPKSSTQVMATIPNQVLTEGLPTLEQHMMGQTAPDPMPEPLPPSGAEQLGLPPVAPEMPPALAA